jgi:hypothetical protein
MIILRPTNLHWIKGTDDDPADLCAHSGVDFRVDDDALVAQNDGDWTVSAAALYLLRTLSPSQLKDERWCSHEHLFPHCGHSMIDIESEDDVIIVGCSNGIHFDVVRDGDTIRITRMSGQTHQVRSGQTYHVGFEGWRDAVCAFSDAVQSFYAASSTKRPCGEQETRGFEKFMAEWSRRRSSATNLR